MYHDSTETDEDQEAIDPALAGVVFNLAYTIHSRVFFQWYANFVPMMYSRFMFDMDVFTDLNKAPGVWSPEYALAT